MRCIAGVEKMELGADGTSHHYRGIASADSLDHRRMLRSCTRLNPLLRLDLGEEASRDDGNHPDPDVRRKEVRRAVKHDVEPPVAAQPSEEAFHHPPDPAGQKTPVSRSAGRD